MSALTELKMDDQGSLRKVEDKKLKATLHGYDHFLLPALQKAEGKCNRSHFTKELCKAMIRDMKHHRKIALKRLAVIESKAKEAYAKQQSEEKAKKEAIKSDKELAGLLKDMAIQMSKLKTVFDNASKSMIKAHSDMKKVMSSEALKGQEKINVLQNVLEKADNAYTKPVESAGNC